jgi:glycosyltransferase involved in cell wall biosynthesis
MALGIADRVEFLGYVPQKDLPTVYAAADFFILPSLREPWGLSALEAMLARLPVLISSKCGCAADVVTPLNGWVFSPHNEGELECLLMKLSEIDCGRREAMGEASFAIAKLYTAEKCANTVIRTVRGAAQNLRITDRPSLGRGTATSDHCEI